MRVEDGVREILGSSREGRGDGEVGLGGECVDIRAAGSEAGEDVGDECAVGCLVERDGDGAVLEGAEVDAAAALRR
ncbi:MAG: hypothetical protein R3B46_02540 [Phycisphaerales bacterium]